MCACFDLLPRDCPSDLVNDLLGVIERHAHVLSKDNITVGGGKRKHGGESSHLEGSLLSCEWEVRETRPRPTMMTFPRSENRGSGGGEVSFRPFSLLPTLPVG